MWTNILKEAAPVGGVIAFAFGVWKYWSEGNRRRKLDAYNFVEKWKERPATRLMLRALDWTNTEVSLIIPPAKEAAFYSVDYDVLATAMVPHDYLPDGFGYHPVHAELREGCIDDFFDSLGQFESLVDGGVILQHDLTILQYWFDLLGGKIARLPADLRRNLRCYLAAYSFTGVVLLAKRFGTSLTATESDVLSLRREVEADLQKDDETARKWRTEAYKFAENTRTPLSAR